MERHAESLEILTVNAGSSTIKAAIFEGDGETLLLPAPDDPLFELVRGALSEVAPNVDVDSIDFLALVTRIDERTGIDIPERDFPSCTTLGGLVAYLRNRRSGPMALPGRRGDEQAGCESAPSW